MQASVPLREWAIADVASWFVSYKGGKYAADASSFEGLDGDEMFDLTEAQFKSRSPRGDILFNAIARLKTQEFPSVVKSPEASPTVLDEQTSAPQIATENAEDVSPSVSDSPPSPLLSPSPTARLSIPPPPPQEVGQLLISEYLKGPFAIVPERELVVDIVIDLVMGDESKKTSVVLHPSMLLGDLRTKIRGLDSNLTVEFFWEGKAQLMSKSLTSLSYFQLELQIGEQPLQTFRVPRFYNIPESFTPPLEMPENDGKEEVKLQVGDMFFDWRLDPKTTLGEFRDKIRTEANESTLLVDFYFENKPQPIKKSLELFKELEVRIGDQASQTLKFVKISGQLQGVHRICFATGDVYDGEWVNGVRSGWGKQVWVDGACFEGQWLDGKAHGRGIYKYPNGAIYDGQWREGKKFGQGRCTYQQGAVYEGEWNNVKQGFGRQTYPDGKIFEGYWKANKRHGHGKQTKPDGSVVEGEWVDNKRVKSAPPGSRPEGKAPERPRSTPPPPPPRLPSAEGKASPVAAGETSRRGNEESTVRRQLKADENPGRGHREEKRKKHEEDARGEKSEEDVPGKADGFVRQRSVVQPAVAGNSGVFGKVEPKVAPSSAKLSGRSAKPAAAKFPEGWTPENRPRFKEEDSEPESFRKLTDVLTYGELIAMQLNGKDDPEDKADQSDAISSIRMAILSKDFLMVMSLMKGPGVGAEARATGCKGLASLAGGWKNELLKARAFALVCDIMRVHSESPEVQGAACQLLACLVEDTPVKKLEQFGVDLPHGHERVLQAFVHFPGDPGVALQASRALGCIAAFDGRHGLLMPADVTGAFNCLLAALNDHANNQQVVEEACSALNKMTADSHELVMRNMLTALLHQRVLGAMVSYPANGRLQQEGLHVIQHIARGYGASSKRGPDDAEPLKLLAQAGAAVVVKAVAENHSDNSDLVRLAKLTLKKLS